MPLNQHNAIFFHNLTQTFSLFSCHELLTKSILLLTTEEYPDAVSTFNVFALQIAISGLQCYFPIHKD